MILVIDLILPRNRLGNGWGSMKMLRPARDSWSVIRTGWAVHVKIWPGKEPL